MLKTETPNRVEFAKKASQSSEADRKPQKSRHPIKEHIVDHLVLYILVILSLLISIGTFVVFWVPQTQAYFIIKHYEDVSLVVSHLQQVNDVSGKKGIDSEMKNILSNK